MVDCKLANADSTWYVYEIKSPHFKSAKKTTSEPRILFDRAELGAAMEQTLKSAPIQISIRTNRQDTTSPPVTWTGIPAALRRSSESLAVDSSDATSAVTETARPAHDSRFA